VAGVWLKGSATSRETLGANKGDATLFEPGLYKDKSMNAIMAIYPYKDRGLWVFDDERRENQGQITVLANIVTGARPHDASP
jgi:hypothetical protein